MKQLFRRLVKSVRGLRKPRSLHVYRPYRIITLPNGERIYVKEIISISEDGRMVVRDIYNRIRVVKA